MVENERLCLAEYVERAYLEYAMSVVKGRALPDVGDGQKPVQRRILYAMKSMGLSHGAKPVKSARVVGEILGKYHPHGDVSAYEAMVRMAQDFTLRYPLIDGIGNFGSRDGDSAAAMRYTEARLSPLARLLLAEIDMGTVDFVPNYDGAFEEPLMLPARLPMVLLNGASGIAVGMATEIPSHNLGEVTAAAVALLKSPTLTSADLMTYIKGPDFAGGGQIISPQEELQLAYETGKGSLRVRARYRVEKLARGQWQVVVYELPPGTSARHVLSAIEDITNPKPKANRKQLTQEQQNNKTLLLSLLERVRDESDHQSPVRLVFEPKSSRSDPDEFMNTLMAKTSLEGNVSVNLVMIGENGKPARKNLHTILREWLDFRVKTVTRRLNHRLMRVAHRLHILDGRRAVFVHIDEVIYIIRNAENPKAELMAKFTLSDIQADDILEIRLRQLAKLEWLELQKELDQLAREQNELNTLLNDEKKKKSFIIKEMQQDAAEFGDERRTLVQPASRAALTYSRADEPVTVTLSRNGYLKSRAGHALDTDSLTFKEGDALLQLIESRSIWPLILLDSSGRAYTINIADIPGGRGEGTPLSALIDMPSDEVPVAMISGDVQQRYLFANTGGYGFVAPLGDLISRIKAGKAFLTLKDNEKPLVPLAIPSPAGSPNANPIDYLHLVMLSNTKHLLAVKLSEIKVMAKGRGLQLMSLPAGSELTHIILTCKDKIVVGYKSPRNVARQEVLRLVDIVQKRGKKGQVLNIAGSLVGLGEVKGG